jgi:hypothetical protein
MHDTTAVMTPEMQCLEADIRHLVDTQNREHMEVDDRGNCMNTQLSEEISRLERVWSHLYDQERAAAGLRD